MRVYKLYPSNCYALLNLKGYEGARGILLFPEWTLSGRWDPPEVEIFDEQDDDPPPPFWVPRPADYTTVMGAPAFNQKAIDALSDILTTRGEILPLIYLPETYHAYNVTNLVHFDETRSDAGKTVRGDRYTWIERPSFHVEDVVDSYIFKLTAINPDGSVYYSSEQSPYVTDQFVQRVQEAELTGFDFQEVWSDE